MTWSGSCIDCCRISWGFKHNSSLKHLVHTIPLFPWKKIILQETAILFLNKKHLMREVIMFWILQLHTLFLVESVFFDKCALLFLKRNVNTIKSAEYFSFLICILTYIIRKAKFNVYSKDFFSPSKILSTALSKNYAGDLSFPNGS